MTTPKTPKCVIVEHVASVNNEHDIAFAANLRGANLNGVTADSLIGADAPVLIRLFLPRIELSGWQQFYDTVDARTNDNIYVLNPATTLTDRSGALTTFPECHAARFNNPFNSKADKAVDARFSFIQSG